MRNLPLILCFALLAPCCLLAQETAPGWIEAGDAHYREGRYSTAAECYRRALDLAAGDKVAIERLTAAAQSAGVACLNDGEPQRARAWFREAIDRGGETAERFYLMALTHVRASEDDLALAFISSALRLDPTHAQSLELLGWIQYRANHTREALMTWEKIPEGQRSEALLRVIKKAGRDATLESGFSGTQTAHFTIKSDAEVAEGIVRMVGDSLERAYGDVGYDLGVHPNRTISVVLYAEKSFRELAGNDWAGGLFDGKIRLPVQGLDASGRDELDRISRHEYTHVLVTELFPKAPAWLHEGLATCMDGSSVGDARRNLRAAEKLPELSTLRSSFTGIAERKKAQLAYDYSLALVDHVSERFGRVRLAEWLRASAEQGSVAKGFASTFFIDLAEEERLLRKSLVDLQD